MLTPAQTPPWLRFPGASRRRAGSPAQTCGPRWSFTDQQTARATSPRVLWPPFSGNPIFRARKGMEESPPRLADAGRTTWTQLPPSPRSTFLECSERRGGVLTLSCQPLAQRPAEMPSVHGPLRPLDPFPSPRESHRASPALRPGGVIDIVAAFG